MTEAKTTEPTPEKVTVYYVYIGDVFDQKGQRVHRFFHIDTPEANTGAAARIYAEENEARVKEYKLSKPWPTLRHANPGAVLSLDREVDPANPNRFTVYSDTARIVGQWKCEAEVVAWAAEHRAQEMAQRARNLNIPDADLEALKPIRDAIRRMNNLQKGLYLGKVVAFLNR